MSCCNALPLLPPASGSSVPKVRVAVVGAVAAEETAAMRGHIAIRRGLNDCGCVQTGIELIPWMWSCQSCLLLAKPFIIFKPARSTMALGLPDDQSCICQHVPCFAIASVDCREEWDARAVCAGRSSSWLCKAMLSDSSSFIATFCCDLILCTSLALICGRADERTPAPSPGGLGKGAMAG